MKNGIERRRDFRVTLALPVVLMTPQGIIKGKTADISVNGLALILPLNSPKIDDEFLITIKTPGDHKISVTCENVWSSSITIHESVYNAIGVRFTSISSSDREIIASLVEEYYLV